MKNSKLKIIFFGSSKHVIPIIEALNKNFDLFLVATTENVPTDPVVNFCRQDSINCLSVSSLADDSFIRQIRSQKADLGVIADFGIILASEVLEAFPKGIINIHPSLLPKYRGPTPVQTVILNGDKVTGVTVIKIDEQIDHGPILYQEEADIKPDETAEALLSRLFEKASNLLSKTISEYSKDTLNLTDQIHKNATFTKLFTKKDGFIDISNPPDKNKLDRMIHAYFPWPGVWSKFEIRNSKSEIIKLLPGSKIQISGKRPVSYKDFINGYEGGKEFLERLNLV